MHLAVLQYNNGQVDYLNVLDAERFLFNAQLDMAEAQGDVLLSLVNIYKGLGGGWVIDADYTAIHPQCNPSEETAAAWQTQNEQTAKAKTPEEVAAQHQD